MAGACWSGIFCFLRGRTGGEVFVFITITIGVLTAIVVAKKCRPTLVALAERRRKTAKK